MKLAALASYNGTQGPLGIKQQNSNKVTNTKIICIQERRVASLPQNDLFHPKSVNFNLINYSYEARPEGGIAIFIHKSLHMGNVTKFSTNHLEAISAELYLNNSLKTIIINLYIRNQGVTL